MFHSCLVCQGYLHVTQNKSFCYLCELPIHHFQTYAQGLENENMIKNVFKTLLQRCLMVFSLKNNNKNFLLIHKNFMFIPCSCSSWRNRIEHSFMSFNNVALQYYFENIIWWYLLSTVAFFLLHRGNYIIVIIS